MAVFSLFVPIVVTIGVIALVMTIIKNTNNQKTFTKKDGEIMLKNIYVYMVLFVTLMMTIGGSVSVFIGVADYIAPSVYVQPYDDYKEERVQNEIFGVNENIAYSEEKYQEIISQIDQEELEARIKQDYEQMEKAEKETARTTAIRHIIKSLGWIIIPLPIFLYYQRQRPRHNDTNE